MPVLLGALAVAAAVIIWILRVRAAAAATRELVDLGGDVRAAVRRFGFRRAAGNPIDQIEDSRFAAAGVLATLIRLDGDPIAEAIKAIETECRATFRCDPAEAADIAALGRWLSAQSPSADEAMRRLTRRLIKITNYQDRAQLAADLEGMMTRVAAAQDGEQITEVKRHAIRQMRRALEER